MLDFLVVEHTSSSQMCSDHHGAIGCLGSSCLNEELNSVQKGPNKTKDLLKGKEKVKVLPHRVGVDQSKQVVQGSSIQVQDF